MSDKSKEMKDFAKWAADFTDSIVVANKHLQAEYLNPIEYMETLRTVLRDFEVQKHIKSYEEHVKSIESQNEFLLS